MTRALSVGAAVALSTALFVAVQAVLVAAADPAGFYADDAEAILPATGSPLPGGAAVHPATVAALETAPFVTLSVPETFTYTTVRGEAVLVRGANLTRLLDLYDARVTTGSLPAEGPTLLVGAGAGQRLGLGVGDRVVLPGTTHADLVALQVAAVVAADGAVDDELLVDAATGERLNALGRGGAHVVEVVPADADALHAWLDASRSTRPLDVDGPVVARIGATVTLRVTEPNGPAVGGVTLTDGATAVTTDGQGQAAVPVASGTTTWTATKSGYHAATHALRGAPASAGVVVTHVTTSPAAPIPGDPVEVTVHLANAADAPANATIAVTAGGDPVGTLAVTLGAGATTTRTLTTTADAAGDLAVTAGDVTTTVTVLTPEELKAQWRLAPLARDAVKATSPEEATHALFGSLALASGLVGLLAFALFFAGNAALFSRLVHEKRDDLALLRHLGATRGQTRLFALKAMAPVAGAAAAAGLVLGVAAAWLYTEADALTILGHSLHLTWGPGAVLLLAGLAVASTLGAVLASTEAWMRRHDHGPATHRVTPRPIEEVLA